MTFPYEDEVEPRTDADVTLGMGSLLSIFFGVVLICGIFFGFGYSMGRRNTQTTTVAARHTSATTAAEDATAESAKPEVQTPAAPAADTAVTEVADTKLPADKPEPRPSVKHADSAPAQTAPHDTPADDAEAPPPAKPAKTPHTVQSTSAATAPSPTLAAVPFRNRTPQLSKPHAGTAAMLPAPESVLVPGHPLMVQIAAVSREEDAQVLAGALRKRGFSPQVHGGTVDKFFHVQVGPFPDKDQAESVKQHLLADGYNAILK